MRRAIVLIIVIGTLFTLAGCRGEGSDFRATPPSSTATVLQGGPTMTVQPVYPKVGHAPDYSWIAGRVTFTKIQGGCVYIITDQSAIDAALATPDPNNAITGPIVSTAVRSDTSPPLRDITPQTGPMPTQPPGDRFVASGPGWDPSASKDGDYVLLFGRLAGPGDPQEICPGGTAYVVDKTVMNP